ncbi:hypothetical protein GGS21DRAFT_533561 [Xylaria nigripes]|nr:hypothetical protein GGS21DRAFT_533561 [Xylaria nigripes]
MADFAHTLIVAIVASILSVLGFLAITLGLALYWSSIARRIAPNRFEEPPSEKSWPSSSESTQANLVMTRGPSPTNSTSSKSSVLPNNPQEPPKAVLKAATTEEKS